MDGVPPSFYKVSLLRLFFCQVVSLAERLGVGGQQSRRADRHLSADQDKSSFEQTCGAAKKYDHGALRLLRVLAIIFLPA